MIGRGTVLAVGFAAVAGLLTQVQAATGPIGGGSLEPPPGQANIDAQPDLAGPGRAVTLAPAPTGNPLWAVPLRSLSTTRERPIFSPSRRPPLPAIAAPFVVPTPQPQSVEPDRPPLTLVGTITGASSGVGVFVEQTTSNVVRLKTGQDYSGWILRTVHGREADFEKDRRKATLTLPAPGAEPPVQAALPTPVGMQGSGTWRDGDGQMITPPRNASQAVPRPSPTTTPAAPEL